MFLRVRLAISIPFARGDDRVMVSFFFFDAVRVLPDFIKYSIELNGWDQG